MSHKGDFKYFSILKSWCASDKLMNVAWTAPSLILGGLYLSKRMGSLNSLKYFGISFFGCLSAQVAFGPSTMWSKMGIRNLPVFDVFRCADCIDETDGSMVGADMMAGSVL